MLYTCGLDSIGAREGYDLHGSLHNIPAEIVRAECNGEGIFVEAIVRDTALFGRDLVLRRRITSGIGADSFSVEDTLVNEGFREEEYCILYHMNIGYPMLDSGARVIARVDGIEPRTEWSAKNIDTAFEMSEAGPEMEETCYFIKMAEPAVVLVNSSVGKQLTLRYSGDTLPHFVEWKSMASGDYALGFEPCTSVLDGGFEYKRIGAGESVRFSLSIAVNEIK